MNYTIIRDDKQYELYLDCLSEIFDINFSKYPKYEDEFDLLSLLIDDYEKRNYPLDIPSPVDYIKFIMEQKGLVNKDMEKYLGTPSKVSEVLNGKRQLSLNMIKKLHNGLGMSTDILIQDVNHVDDEKLLRTGWLSVLSSEISGCESIEVPVATSDIVKNYRHQIRSPFSTFGVNKYEEVIQESDFIHSCPLN